ncbi:MAG: hypothetical protein LBR60_03445 [Fibrobacter sp.]|jgi:hypothetical protein|nr:hypothetical protein [Fibrobacter sp.]
MKLRIAFFACSLFFMACSGTKSYQQVLVNDRALVYRDTYKAYTEAENRYLNLLFNIERFPEEEELWIMKREQMQEISQLRELMLLARGDLDDALQSWERYLVELQAEKKTEALQKERMMRRQEASSPGELLPQDAENIGRH